MFQLCWKARWKARWEAQNCLIFVVVIWLALIKREIVNSNEAVEAKQRLWFLLHSSPVPFRYTLLTFMTTTRATTTTTEHWQFASKIFLITFGLIEESSLYDIILGCDYNENYRHSTSKLASPSSKYPSGIDVNLYKASNYLNPTYNSKINLCINDDYIEINNCTNRNPSCKRESKFFDENMNYNTSATPLINNAQELKIRFNGSTTGKLKVDDGWNSVDRAQALRSLRNLHR